MGRVGLVRALILVSLMIAVAVSGCVEPAEPTQTTVAAASTPSATSDGPAPSSSTTTTSVAASNQAPTASLNGSVTNGTTPLEVIFTVDGADPEGAPIAWALDFDFDGIADANGSELPTNVTHVFELPGEYSVALNVSDGELEGSASFSIAVVEGVASVPLPVIFEGSALVPDALRLTEGECLFPLLAWAGLPTGGISGDVHEVPGEIIGWNYVLSSDDFVAMWVTAAGGYADEGVAGVVPEGAVDVFVCSEAAVAADYVLTITHPDYVAPA